MNLECEREILYWQFFLSLFVVYGINLFLRLERRMRICATLLSSWLTWVSLFHPFLRSSGIIQTLLMNLWRCAAAYVLSLSFWTPLSVAYRPYTDLNSGESHHVQIYLSQSWSCFLCSRLTLFRTLLLSPSLSPPLCWRFVDLAIQIL